MSSCIRGRHSGIHESNQVGDRVIAEDQVHHSRSLFVSMDVVEFLGWSFRETTATVAPKECARTTPQYSFVGRHPLDAHAVRNCQHFFRDASLGGPHAFGTQPENFL